MSGVPVEAPAQPVRRPWDSHRPETLPSLAWSATAIAEELWLFAVSRRPAPPPRSQVRSPGHKSRLDRDLKTRFGAREYAAEELVAELGAAFLSAEFGFDGDVRNAGYIASWIELFKADKRAFFTACSKASKAADYLRGLALSEPAAMAA